MDGRVTPPRRVTSPTWCPPAPSKQTTVQQNENGAFTWKDTFRALRACFPAGYTGVFLCLFRYILFCFNEPLNSRRNLVIPLDLQYLFTELDRVCVIFLYLVDWETALLLLHLVWVYFCVDSKHQRSSCSVSTSRRWRAR